MSAPKERLQGGMDNDELREAWDRKLPGVVPTDREMTAFALGVEVGDGPAQVYYLERNSARDAWRGRMKQCEELELRLTSLQSAAEGLEEALIEALEDSQIVIDQHVQSYGENYRPARLKGMRDQLAKGRAALSAFNAIKEK